jgi:hypothetical protein
VNSSDLVNPSPDPRSPGSAFSQSETALGLFAGSATSETPPRGRNRSLTSDASRHYKYHQLHLHI